MTVLVDRVECLPLQNVEIVERTVPAFRKYPSQYFPMRAQQTDLTGNEMIPFKVIHFREGGKQKGGNNNEEERPQIKTSLKNGRMAVTSQRIIFICLNESGENAIKKGKNEQFLHN